MPITAVVNRYANAFADVLTSPASLVRPEKALAELRSVEGVFRESADLRNALETPAVPASRKRAVVARIGELLQISQVTRNFLFVLVDHRRISGLPEIVQTLDVVLDERLGFARADVTAARELTEVQRTALNAELEQISGKRIRARYGVDPSLIGGVVARIGSTVYDGSVSGQLHSLRRRLSQEV
jgi:F-type H+-transporting ATPase subunit delta